jgi:hypothetical protein
MPTFFAFTQKNQLHMCQSHLYHELLFAQIVSSRYTPSLLHIPKMMMNVVTTSQPTTKYSTHLHALPFSTPLLLLLFSTILLPPPTFVYCRNPTLRECEDETHTPEMGT